MPAALIDTADFGYCAVFKGRREAPRGIRGPVSQNSTACAGSSSTVCGAGQARFGRRTRPHDRVVHHIELVAHAPRSGGSKPAMAPCRTGPLIRGSLERR